MIILENELSHDDIGIDNCVSDHNLKIRRNDKLMKKKKSFNPLKLAMFMLQIAYASCLLQLVHVLPEKGKHFN